MLNRTLNMSRTAFTNFVRHHSHGGIPGEVRHKRKNEELYYATIYILDRFLLWFIFLELAIRNPQQV